MVALSVSTSARLSSDLIISPTFLFQPTIFPSVIVSLNKGIRITVTPSDLAMLSASADGAVLAGTDVVFSVVAAAGAAAGAGAGLSVKYC